MNVLSGNNLKARNSNEIDRYLTSEIALAITGNTSAEYILNRFIIGDFEISIPRRLRASLLTINCLWNIGMK